MAQAAVAQRVTSAPMATSRSPFWLAFRKVVRNRPAALGLAVVVLIVLAAVFAPLIAPYSYAQQNLDESAQAPSFKHLLGTDDLGRDMLTRIIYGARSAMFVIIAVTLINLTLGLALGAVAGYLQGSTYSLWIFLVQAVLLAAPYIAITVSTLGFFIALLFSPAFAVYVLAVLTVGFWASRMWGGAVWWGVLIALLAPLIAFLAINAGVWVVGGGAAVVLASMLLVGAVWLLARCNSRLGQLKGWTGRITRILFAFVDLDSVISRISDILFAFPGLLFVFFIAATIKPGLIAWVKASGLADLAKTGMLDYLVVFVALGAVGWPGLARLVRGQVLTLRSREFVISAQAVGVPLWGVMARHLIPNALGPLIVAISMSMGSLALSESYLSYLGIGLQPPNPSWGNILADNARFYWRQWPQMIWLVFAPGAVLAAVVFAFNFLGDGLNEALNPEV
jgi:ABC-type dipeptide/oligopeptide/nickel transport system permease subunit